MNRSERKNVSMKFTAWYFEWKLHINLDEKLLQTELRDIEKMDTG